MCCKQNSLIQILLFPYLIISRFTGKYLNSEPKALIAFFLKILAEFSFLIFLHTIIQI